MWWARIDERHMNILFELSLRNILAIIVFALRYPL